MIYVYIIQSEAFPDEWYTGLCDDLRQRLKDHNEGKSPHTRKFKPWRLDTYLAFSSKKQAAQFEQYLKSGLGRAFAKKRLRSEKTK